MNYDLYAAFARYNADLIMAALPTETERSKVENAQGHIWWTWHGIVCCQKCGILKRKEGVNKPCPGIVKIALR